MMSINAEPYYLDSNSSVDGWEEKLLSDEGHQVVDSHDVLQVKVYRRRWYVLLVFCAVSFFQAMVWNTWSPLDVMMKLSYHWTNITLATLSNWSTFTYLLLFWPFSYLMEKKGLKFSIIWASFLVFVSTAIRCIPTSRFFTWLAHTGAILNGIAGVVMWSIPPALSALWFPPHQRTTATGLGSMAPQLGVAGGYISAYFLKGPYNKSRNSVTAQFNNATDIHGLKKDIMEFLYVEAVWGLCIFLCVICYFPRKPLLPPSITSSMQRLQIRDGLKLLARKKDACLILVSASITQGFPSAWTGLMDLSLEPLGVSQQSVALIGTWAILASCLGALIVSRLNDLLRGYLKLTLSLLMLGACLCYVWMALLCLQVIPFSEVQLYLTVILGTTLNFGAYPLFLEGAVEVAYPVPEALIGGLLGFGSNCISGLFYFVFFIPDIGYLWMNYALIGSSAIVLPLLFIVTVTYNRLDKDEQLLS